MAQTEKLAGIWMDHQEAFVISNHDGKTINTLEVKAHVKADYQGGYGSEHTSQNAKKNALHKFFQEAMQPLANTEELHLIGTGTAQEELMHYLAEIPQWKKMKVTQDTAGKMGADQALNAISEHYKHRL